MARALVVTGPTCLRHLPTEFGGDINAWLAKHLTSRRRGIVAKGLTTRDKRSASHPFRSPDVCRCTQWNAVPE
jgi:hypothetical protein